jgi:hypothetical protein
MPCRPKPFSLKLMPPPPPPGSSASLQTGVNFVGAEAVQFGAQQRSATLSRCVRAPCPPSCAATRAALGCWPPTGARLACLPVFGFACVILARAQWFAVPLAADALLQQLDCAPAGVLRSAPDVSQRARAQLQRFCRAAARGRRRRGSVRVGARRLVAAVGRALPRCTPACRLRF